MKTITCYSYTTSGYVIIVFLSLILTSSLLYSQSSIVFDAGTNIDVGTGADVCAGTITINGTYSGTGTFCNGPLAIEVDSVLVPDKFDLSQNYPNPFNPSTKIKYTIAPPNLPQGEALGKVTLRVYDVLGNEVATLVNEEKPAGVYEVNFDASQLSSGIYMYKLQTGSFVQSKKMMLLK